MFTANKQKLHQWQIVEVQQKHKHKIQLVAFQYLSMYLILWNSLGVIHWAGWPFGPLFSLDLVPYRNKGSTHLILKQFSSMEPSNKANTVCVQLLRPCNSSEGVQDYFFLTKWIPYLRFEILKNHTLSGDPYLPTLYKGLSPPSEDTCHVQANMDPDVDGEYQVIHEFSVAKFCFCYLNIFEFKYMKWFTSFFGDMSQEVSCLS